jgi:hypothetical protein
MAARVLAIAAFALLAAGCGGRVYSDAAAQETAGSPSGYTDIAFGAREFATLAAVTDLELDPSPLFTLYEGGRIWVIRYASAHDARAAVRDGEIRQVDAQVVGGARDAVVERRENLVLAGSRAAVAAALRRLPK